MGINRESQLDNVQTVREFGSHKHKEEKRSVLNGVFSSNPFPQGFSFSYIPEPEMMGGSKETVCSRHNKNDKHMNLQKL